MVAIDCCPDASVLEALALGRLAPEEVERLAAHCENCQRCILALQQLPTDDALLQTIRSGVRAASEPLPKQVQAVMQRLMDSSIVSGVLTPDTQTFAKSSVGQSTDIEDGDAQSISLILAEECGFLAPPQSPDELGRLGAYRVLRVLGAGGMGIVFLAEDQELNRLVAIKAMKSTLAAGVHARQRFLREARAMAAVHHDHIIPIYQIDQAGAVPFLVMPYLDGEMLEDRLLRQGRLPVAEVVRIGREIAAGLAAAHARGLLHRDIKPSNIWLEGESGRVKILDFGLVRTMDDDTNLTTTGAIAGTPAYMAPEQARGDEVDNRCDLFSLGCVLYRMATGEPAFPGRNVVRILRAVANEQPKEPSAVCAEVPAALSALIMRLLAKEANDRLPSAQAVIEALAAIEAGPHSASGAAPPPAPVPRTTPSKPRGRLLALAVVLILVMAPLGYYFGGPVVRLITNQGVLVIESDANDIEVTIRRDDVVVYDQVHDRRYLLTPGEYDVQVVEQGKDGLRFATRHFVIARGGNETFRVRLEPLVERAEGAPEHPIAATSRGEVAPKLPPQRPTDQQPDAGRPKVRDDRPLATWVLSVGGRLDLNYRGRPMSAASLADLPPGAFVIAQLNLSGCPISDDDLKHLAGYAGPNLILSSMPITDAGLAHLANLTELEGLLLENTRINGSGFVHLKNLKKLKTLKLRDVPLADTCFSHLADLNLKSLLILCETVTDAGMEQVAGIQTLESFGVSGTKVTDQGLAHLGKLPNLQTLYIAETRITGVGFEHFNTPKLTELGLQRTQLNDAGLAHLTGMNSLKILSLDGTRITDAGLQAVSNLTNLETLTLSSTRITDACFEHLAGLAKLQMLMLRFTNLTDASLPKIARYPRLQTLALQATLITDQGLAHLKSMKQLKYLNLQDTDVTPAAVAELKAALPECEIVH